VEIRVISSLTPDDEVRYAATFVKMIAAVLDDLSPTYAIQVTHVDGVLVHRGQGEAPVPEAERRSQRPAAR
jgi:hypothetical protein